MYLGTRKTNMPQKYSIWLKYILRVFLETKKFGGTQPFFCLAHIIPCQKQCIAISAGFCLWHLIRIHNFFYSVCEYIHTLITLNDANRIKEGGGGV